MGADEIETSEQCFMRTHDIEARSVATVDVADGDRPQIIVRHGDFTAVLSIMGMGDHLCIDVHPFVNGRVREDHMSATVTVKLPPKDFDMLRECIKLSEVQLRAQYRDSDDATLRNEVAKKLGAIEDLTRRLN